jgi:hypothetical protein
MRDLLAAFDAFVQGHRRCGRLRAAVRDGVVWVVCDCGGTIVHWVNRGTVKNSDGRRAALG